MEICRKNFLRKFQQTSGVKVSGELVGQLQNLFPSRLVSADKSRVISDDLEQSDAKVGHRQNLVW